MRKFYEEWMPIFGSLAMNQMQYPFSIGSLSTNQLDESMVHDSLTVQFTHHYTLLTSTDNLDERLYYIHRIATEFWSVEKLRYNLAEHLY